MDSDCGLLVPGWDGDSTSHGTAGSLPEAFRGTGSAATRGGWDRQFEGSEAAQAV